MTALIRFARAYLSPFIHWYLLGGVALLITNLLSVRIPVLVGQAVDAIGTDPSQVGPIAMRIGLYGLAIIGVRWLSRVLFFTPGRHIEATLKVDLFKTFLKQQPRFHAKHAPGDLMSRATSDINFLRLLSGFVVLQTVNAALALPLGVAQMLHTSSTLAAWSLLTIAGSLAFIQLFVRRMFFLVHRMQAELSQLSELVLSTYQGVETLHNFSAEAHFERRFNQQNNAYLQTALRRSEMRAVIRPTMLLSTSISLFFVLYLGGPMVISGELSLGDLATFSTLIAFLASPLAGLSFLISAVKQGQAALFRVDELLYAPVDRPDLPDGQHLKDGPPTVRVEQLNFSFSPDTPVLKDINLLIPAGSTLGIIGPTGSGKSTLLSCLARLHNPPQGSVFINDTELNAIDLDHWREQLSLVPQRAFLFSDSLETNIRLGVKPTTPLDAIIEMTALGPDINALPQGLKTLVGESGVMLSGGQRQRAALARGLIRRPGLLMLDDVLSAVDHETEAALIHSLQQLSDTPTTIIVANRISALQHADQIAVIEEGRITAIGDHAHLLSCSTFYRDVWNKQRLRPRP